MTIFKYFNKIANKHKAEIIIPIIIFVGFAFLSSYSSQKDYSEYKATIPPIAIINNDTTVGTGLMEYLEDKVELVDIKQEKFQEAIFYQHVVLTLEIPEGYTNDFLNNGIELNADITTNSAKGYIAQSYINEYLNYYRSFYDLGYTHQEIQERIMSTSDTGPEVVILPSENNGDMVYRNYTGMSIYPLSIAVMSILMPLLVAFGEKKVLARTEVSSTKPSKRNLQLLLGSLLIGHALWILTVVISTLLMKSFIDWDTYIFNVLNSYLIFIVMMAFSFFASKIAKSESAQSAISNTVTLGLSFISGVFVPSQYLASSIVNLSKLFPYYWNIQVNELIYQNTISIKELGLPILIQILYAVVLVILGVLISRNREKSTI